MEIKLRNASIRPYIFRSDLCIEIDGIDENGQFTQYVVGFDMDIQCCEECYLLLGNKIKIEDTNNGRVFGHYLHKELCYHCHEKNDILVLTIDPMVEKEEDDILYHCFVKVNIQWGNDNTCIEFHNIHNGYYGHKLYVNKAEVVYERFL